MKFTTEINCAKLMNKTRAAPVEKGGQESSDLSLFLRYPTSPKALQVRV